MGEIGRVGRTALFISELRALELAREQPLFKDRFAPLFSDPEVKQAVDSYRQRLPVFFAALRVRTRWFDDAIQKEIAGNIRQVVILGAGFDCRPLRFGRPDIAFFEVDEQALLEYKRDRLAGAGHTPNSVFVPANYCAPGLIDKLCAHGFDPKLSTLVVWEGNTYYLPPALPSQVLRTISDGMRDVRVLCDVMESPVIDGRSKSPGMRQVVAILRGMGAPWQFGIDDLSAFASSARMRVAETARFGDLHAKYLPGEDIGDDRHVEYVMGIFARDPAQY